MKLQLSKRVGKKNYVFEVEGKDLHEVVMESQKLSFNDISMCGLCGSDNLYLNAYITKEDKFKYVKIVCFQCKASLTFGQVKASPETYYIRKNEQGKQDWQAYVEPKKDQKEW